MSNETDPPRVDSDPIDADFEPAPSPSGPVIEEAHMRAKSGPGWGALALTGVLAALFGGGIGSMVGATGQGAYAPETLVSDVQVLAAGQSEQEARLGQLVSDLETRMRREMTTISASGGDGEAIADLATQLTRINNQLEALEVNAQEDGEAEGLQLDQIMARIEALEKLDEDEVASPRVANRAIKSVQRRIEELEAELATRSDVLKDLEERLALAEETASQNTAPADNGEVEDALSKVAEEIEDNAKAIDELRGEVRAIGQDREDVGATQASDTAQLRRWVEELRAKDAEYSERIEETGAGQSATFSILSIEAAARDGRPFQSAFARLEKAMPGNRSVRKLRPLAAKGAPTMAMLQTGFTAAREAAEAINMPTEDVGRDEKDGWGWVRNALGDAVTVRRSGTASQEEENFASLMDVAFAELQAGDLEEAIDVVETLEAGPRKEAFGAWLADARGRLALEEGLDELRLTLMNQER